MELVGHGIRVNSLTPTATDPEESFERATRWGRTVKKPEGLDRVMAPFREGIPMKKLPVPSDYGKAAVFLASDDAAMITGTDLRVDAGAIALISPLKQAWMACAFCGPGTTAISSLTLRIWFTDIDIAFWGTSLISENHASPTCWRRQASSSLTTR